VTAAEKVTEFPEVTDQQVMAHEESLHEEYNDAFDQYVADGNVVHQAMSPQRDQYGFIIPDRTYIANSLKRQVLQIMEEARSAADQNRVKKRRAPAPYSVDIPQATKDWVDELKRLEYDIGLHLDSAPADGDEDYLKAAKIRFSEGRFNAVHAVTAERKVT
jgi:hypothetical protein